MILILGFGLPVYMLPKKWNGEQWYNKVYNSTIGNESYLTKVKPWVDKLFGGTLRLFTEWVYNDSFDTLQETSLFVRIKMPHGATLAQADLLISSMEKYLKKFSGIRLFQANISQQHSSIRIFFTEKSIVEGLPYELKAKIIAKGLEIGGADWSVNGYGVGFGRSIQEQAGDYSLCLMGYNYDELCLQAKNLEKKLKEHPRIKEVFIVAEPSWYKPDNSEFMADVNSKVAIINNITNSKLYSSFAQYSFLQPAFATVVIDKDVEDVKLLSSDVKSFDIWQMQQMPLNEGTNLYKFNLLGMVKKEITSSKICKKNQQYQLYLQFDYNGSNKFARKFINRIVDDFKPRMPLGYSLFDGESYWWGQESKKQYWLLALIVVMIFFICAILFESLLQPLAVILTIPLGYIGIFLTFYIFHLTFDQGGFAAMVMLCGITVNAAIYIINDYNHLRREYAGRKVSNMKLYFKAFNYKIIPILLTVVSTVLGFVPFLIGEKQAFWFSLAAGTIGGLLFSLVGIIFYLPLFLKIKK